MDSLSQLLKNNTNLKKVTIKLNIIIHDDNDEKFK